MADKSICSIPDCNKSAYVRGFCMAHYTRLVRHGDPLGGRTSQGEPMRWIEEVALRFDGTECLIWPFAKYRNGYGIIRHEGRATVVSRLICKMANGEPPTPDHEAAHECGNGALGCVSPKHLRWATHADNCNDTSLHGKTLRGALAFGAVLTEQNVLDIRRRADGGESHVVLAREFGVIRQNISMVVRRKTWSHI